MENHISFIHESYCAYLVALKALSKYLAQYKSYTIGVQ